MEMPCAPGRPLLWAVAIATSILTTTSTVPVAAVALVAFRGLLGLPASSLALPRHGPTHMVTRHHVLFITAIGCARHVGLSSYFPAFRGLGTI
jgi:hypothetical protein